MYFRQKNFFPPNKCFRQKYFVACIQVPHVRLGWRRKLHRLPEGYKLTHCATANEARKKRTARQAYVRWFFACERENLPALRKCNASDFSIKSQKARFFDWKKLIDRIQWYLHNHKDDSSIPKTEQEAQVQFDKAIDIHYDIYVRNFHPASKKRNRRCKKTNAAVSTVVEEMRLVQNTLTRISLLIKHWNAITSFQRVVKLKYMHVK